MDTTQSTQAKTKANVLRASKIGCLVGTIAWLVLLLMAVLGLWVLDAVMGVLNPTHRATEAAPLGMLLTVVFALVSAPVGGIIGAALGALVVFLMHQVRARAKVPKG